MKNVVKFKFQEKEGFLSFIEKADHNYALVQKDTPKVEEIKHSHKLLISYDLKQPNYKEVIASVLFDEHLVKWVYDKLEAEKNLYFKELDDSLCVLEFTKK